MNKDQLVTYMVGGYFSANKGWKHNPRFHHGDYELIVCTSGPIYLSIGNDNVTLNQNDILLVPPYVVMQGNKVSERSINFYWLHFLLPDDHRIFKNTTCQRCR
jgi:quercetin dioxygenase-like cupin family protein